MVRKFMQDKGRTSKPQEWVISAKGNKPPLRMGLKVKTLRPL